MNLASVSRHDLTVCSAGSVAIAGTPEQPNEGGNQQDCSEVKVFYRLLLGISLEADMRINN